MGIELANSLGGLSTMCMARNSSKFPQTEPQLTMLSEWPQQHQLLHYTLNIIHVVYLWNPYSCKKWHAFDKSFDVIELLCVLGIVMKQETFFKIVLNLNIPKISFLISLSKF